MFIVCVTSCPAGIAHTFMAAESLRKAALAKGIELKIETQGATGRDNEITEEDCARADAAIVAADVSISGAERFADIPTLEVSVSEAIKKAPKLLAEVIGAVG